MRIAGPGSHPAGAGRNVDYLRDLVAHLRVEGVPDPAMETLLAKAEALDPCARVRTAA